MSTASSSGHNRTDEHRLNADVNWNLLDSDLYLKKNYATPHKDDLEFIGKVRDFLAEHLRGQTGLNGIDVGAGSNLYPTLAMLPFCSDITLLDFSETNVAWLKRELDDYSPTWDPFWAILSEDPAYEAIEPLRETLRQRAAVRTGTIYDLPHEHWHVGTMFFVAESISTEIGEFRSAVSSFIAALKPGAPFAAAFMENSEGWEVGSAEYPAVAVSELDVTEALIAETKIHEVCRRPVGVDALRTGYTGMILVCGTKLDPES